MRKASAGTSTTTNGADVVSWINQAQVESSQAINLTEATNQPSYLENSINFNPVLDFDGTEQLVDVTEGELGLAIGGTNARHAMFIPNNVNQGDKCIAFFGHESQNRSYYLEYDNASDTRISHKIYINNLVTLPIEVVVTPNPYKRTYNGTGTPFLKKVTTLFSCCNFTNRSNMLVAICITNFFEPSYKPYSLISTLLNA